MEAQSTTTPSSEEEVQVEEATEAEEQESTPSIEDIAKEWGWNPKGEKSAAEFVKAERDITRRLERKLEHVDQKWDSKFKEFASQETARAKKALEKQREELMAERRKAVEEGDTDKFDQVDKKLQTLEEPSAVDERQKAFAAYEAKWSKENPWVNESPAMNGAAVKIGQELLKENPEMGPDEFYPELTKRIKEEFPHKFRNEQREGKPDVESEKPSSGGKESNWKKLTSEMPEAKQYFQHFVKEGVYKDTKEDREEYARQALEAD